MITINQTVIDDAQQMDQINNFQQYLIEKRKHVQSGTLVHIIREVEKKEVPTGLILDSLAKFDEYYERYFPKLDQKDE